MLPDPLSPLPLVLLDVVTAGETLGELTLATEGEAEPLDDPLSCTPSARAVKPEPPAKPPDGLLGLVMFDDLKFTSVVLTALSCALIVPLALMSANGL